jgi:hypothetical protein
MSQSGGHFTCQRNSRNVGQLGLVAASPSLSLPTQADVSDNNRVVFRLVKIEAAGAELDWEHASVGTLCIQLRRNR